MRRIFTLTSAMMLVAASSTHADVFMADTFSYSNGQLSDTLLNEVAGDNVGGGNWVAHSGDTFDDNVDIINGAAELLASGSEDINRSAGSTMGIGGKWYYAAQVTVNDTRFDANLEALNNDYFIHFKDSGFGFRGRTYIDEPNVFSTTTFTFGMSATSGGQFDKWATDLTFGTQYTIVTEYDFDSGDTRLWVDPVDINSTFIADTIVLNSGRNENSPETAIEALGLRQDFLGGTPNNQVLVDNVSIGDSFADVLAALGTDVNPGGGVDVDLDDDGDVDGADFLAIQRTDPSLIPAWQSQFGSGALSVVTAVPEPSSVMLIGLAMALIPLARRQRA